VVASGALLVYSAAFLGLVVGTVYIGYTKSVVAYVNLGLLFFVLYMGYLYLAKIATYLGKSLALVGGGLTLIVGGAYLEKKRRGMVEDMEADALWT